MAIAFSSIGIVWARAQQTSIGITAGTGASWMSNAEQPVVPKPSYNIGASLVHSTETHWGFGVDVKYSREGYKHTYESTTTMSQSVSSDFIRVPIRAIYFFNNNTHAVRPNIAVGPSLGILTGGEIRTEDENHVYAKTPVKDTYRSFDFGIQGSLGLNIKLAETMWLSTDVVYYQGLAQQNKDGLNTLLNSHAVFNLALRVGIGK